MAGFGNSILNGWLDIRQKWKWKIGLKSVTCHFYNVLKQPLWAKAKNGHERVVTRSSKLTGLSFQSLQSLHLKQPAKRAKKIITDSFTPLTPFSTNSLLVKAPAHSNYLLKIQLLSYYNKELKFMKMNPAQWNTFALGYIRAHYYAVLNENCGFCFWF